MSWLKQTISRVTESNTSSADNDKRRSKNDIQELVQKYSKMVSNLKKDEPPDQCIKFYMENFSNFKQKRLTDLQLQSETNRIVRHLVLFIDDIIENVDRSLMTYNFLNSAMNFYNTSSRTDAAYFKLFIKASQTEDTQIIEAALPFINTCLQFSELISLFFSGDELVSIWTNIFIGSQKASEYIGSMINMSLTNMPSIPHTVRNFLSNSPGSSISSSLSTNAYLSTTSTLIVSTSPIINPASTDPELQLISSFLEKVYNDINNNVILPSIAPRAFMFLGLIIRNINTGDFLPSICENIRQIAPGLDNLDFLEPFIQAHTSDPLAIWSLIDAICADENLPINLLISSLNAIHNSGSTPPLEVFSFNSFIPRLSELSEQHRNVLFDIIASSEIMIKVDFFCESLPLSKTGVNTKYLNRIARGVVWGDVYCDNIIDCFLIKPDLDEVSTHLKTDKYYVAITECLISQIRYQSQYTPILFKIFSKVIIETLDKSICYILTLLLCRTNPNHYMSEVVDLLAKDGHSNELILKIFSFVTVAVRRFCKIFIKFKGIDVLKYLFETKAGIDFLACLVVDGPYKKIDEYIYQNFEKSPLKSLKDSQLIRLMMGLPQDDNKESEKASQSKTSSAKKIRSKGLLRIPSLCAFVKDVPLLSPYDMYIYGAHATQYFTPTDEQIKKFSSVYIPKNLLNKVMTNWEEMINLTRQNVDYTDVLQFHQEPNLMMPFFSASKLHHSTYDFPYSTEQMCSVQTKHTASLSFWFKILNMPTAPTIIATFGNFQLLFDKNCEISIDSHSNKCEINKWHLASFVLSDKSQQSNVVTFYFDGKQFCDLALPHLIHSSHQPLSTITFGSNSETNKILMNNSKTPDTAKPASNSPRTLNLAPQPTVKSDWLLIPYIHTSQTTTHQQDIKKLYESGPYNISKKRLKPSNTVRLVHYRGVLKQIYLFGGPIYIFQEMMKTTVVEQFQMQLIVAFNFYKLGFFSRTLFFSLLRYIIRKHLDFAKPSEMFIMNEFSSKDGFNWKDFSLVMGDSLLLATPTFKGRILTKTMLYMQPNYEDLRIFYQAIEIFSYFDIDQETMNNMLTIISLYLEKNPAKRSLLLQRSLLNVIALPFFDSDDANETLYDERVEKKQKLLFDILSRDKQHFMQTLSFKLAINHLQMLHPSLAIEFFYYLSQLCIENSDYFDLNALQSASAYLYLLVDQEKFWVSILRMIFEFSGSSIKKFLKREVSISYLTPASASLLMELITMYLPLEFEQSAHEKEKPKSLTLKLLQMIENYVSSINNGAIYLSLIKPAQNLCSLGFGQRDPTEYPFKIHLRSNSDNDLENLNLKSSDNDNSNSNSASSSLSKFDDSDLTVNIDDEELVYPNIRKRSSSSSRPHNNNSRAPNSTKPSYRHRIGSIDKRLSKPDIRPLMSEIEPSSSVPIVSSSKSDFSAENSFGYQLVISELQKMEPQLFDETFRHFSNNQVDLTTLRSSLSTMFSRNFNSILYEKEEEKEEEEKEDKAPKKKGNEKTELIPKDLRVDFCNYDQVLNSQQAQLAASIAAKILSNLEGDPNEFKKGLLRLTIFGGDVLPKVAIEMHRKVILTLVGENKINVDTLYILVDFILPRIIEGWWDSPNMLARLFTLIIRNASIYNQSLCPFIFVCFYQLSQKNSVEYLKQMGYALFGSPLLGQFLAEDYFYQSIIHLVLTSQIQDSRDGSAFFLFMIEQIHKHFESPHLKQLKEVIQSQTITKRFSDYDPNIDLFQPVSDTEQKGKDLSNQHSANSSDIDTSKVTKTDNNPNSSNESLLSIKEWIDQNKGHYHSSYLTYHRDILQKAAHDHATVKSERLGLSQKTRAQCMSEYMSYIIKEITEIRRVFRYQFFSKVNRSCVFMERAINALFKNKQSIERSVSTITKKVALVPGPHPLVVPTKLVPMLFEYKAPYKKTGEPIEIPFSETIYPDRNSALIELRKPVVGPKCLEGYSLPVHIKHASIYSIFKNRFNGVSEPFLCYFLLSPEILRCVAVMSNNNIHILMNATISNGIITLSDKIMLCHYPIIENAMHGLYGESSLFLGHVVLNISFSSITLALPRTYLYEPIALDLFTSYGCHFSLSMNAATRNSLLERIQVKPVSNSKRGILFANRLLSKQMDEVMKLWKNNHLSNYDYLLYLNIVSGRSFNDLSQYPVFPWVIGNYSTDNPNVLRDLSKPMGQLTSKRTEHYDSVFKETKQSYFYGTHYSYPTSVMYFLMRIEPCTLYNVMLHSGFDHPDRQFFSILDSYRSASEVNQADVRELIPELYSLPELLTNVNQIELQKRTTGASIDNVVLPPWAHNDPIKFVWQMRAALESPEVTKNLPSWIDLIFGYKQRGKAAIEAKNLFHPISYNTFVKEKDSEFYKAQKDSIINFGQCPNQLLRETAHPQKSLRALNSLDNMDVRECIIKHLPHYTYHIRIYGSEIIPSPYFSFFLGNPPFLVHVYEGFMTVKGEPVIVDQLFDPTAVAVSSENTTLTIATGAGIILNYYFDPSAQHYLISSSILPNESFISVAISGHFGLYCAATKTEVFLFDLASGFLMKKVESKGSVLLIEFDEVHDFIITVSDHQITVYTTNMVPIAHKEFLHIDSNGHQEAPEQPAGDNQGEEVDIQQFDESQEDKEESEKREENDNEEEENEEDDEEDSTENSENENDQSIQNAENTEKSENTENTENTDAYTDTVSNNNNNNNKDNNSNIDKNNGRSDHLIGHVNNCVTSLATVDSTIWYPKPFFVTGHNDGSVYLWQINPLENKLKPLCLLSHRLKNKITAIRIFRRNQALVCCDVKGNAETISTEILLKDLLKPYCFDRCSKCFSIFESEDQIRFCSLCGLPYCKKCFAESNPRLCKICENKDMNNAFENSSVRSAGSNDQDD